MKHYKNKLIFTGTILFLLFAAFFWNGQSAVKMDVQTAQPATSPHFFQAVLQIAKTCDSPESANIPLSEEKLVEETLPLDEKEHVEAANLTQDTETKLTCTLSVRCDTIQNHMEQVPKEKESLIPKDGVIYAAKTVEFYEGESVFHVLQRELMQNGIHLEFSSTPAFQSVYIEGIQNLYELDFGALSGWLYCVNGIFPNYSCSVYELEDGDVIEWLYTCDSGRDIGSSIGSGGQ